MGEICEKEGCFRDTVEMDLIHEVLGDAQDDQISQLVADCKLLCEGHAKKRMADELNMMEETFGIDIEIDGVERGY
jgi:hypothetical protein